MKVYILHLYEDTQVCSTVEKAIEAAKKALSEWAVEIVIEEITTFDDITEIVYFCPADNTSDTAWIYPYEIDGGAPGK